MGRRHGSGGWHEYDARSQRVVFLQPHLLIWTMLLPPGSLIMGGSAPSEPAPDCILPQLRSVPTLPTCSHPHAASPAGVVLHLDLHARHHKDQALQ